MLQHILNIVMIVVGVLFVIPVILWFYTYMITSAILLAKQKHSNSHNKSIENVEN